MAQALRTAHTAQDLQALVKPEHSQWPLRIGEVAKLLGVRVSAVRFWEDTGLLQPRRNTQSGYRLYDARHFEQARLVSSLRKAGCDLDSIRLVLPELAAHRPEQVLTIVEGRLVEIANASLRCSRAMVDFWNYLEHLNPNILDQIEYQRYYGPRKISPSPLDTPEAE